MDATRAHPRSRGENHQRLDRGRRAWGSSPLTRGKQSRCRSQEIVSGLIPAHAGKTRPPAEAADGTTAHPRSRGENTPEDRARLRIQGSSPLTRGKRSEDRQGEACRGLIPAHAGKTSTWLFVSLVTWAHPRSRGENQSKHTRSPACAGSSPLTRGKRHSQRDRLPTDRLIPAHAGKTGAGAGYFSERAAHPRSRGENWFVRHPGCVASGSSPLTRGKQRTTPAPITVDGLIPAHAGKTGDGGRDPERAQAHPRSRGENLAWLAFCAAWSGSSPLTRGKRSWLLGEGIPPRLIPAHAGKTARGHGP